MTEKQLHMLKHAWGYDTEQPGYRDRYCIDLDDEDMKGLVDGGFFEGPHYVGQVVNGCGMFFVTEKGVEHLKQLKDREGMQK